MPLTQKNYFFLKNFKWVLHHWASLFVDWWCGMGLRERESIEKLQMLARICQSSWNAGNSIICENQNPPNPDILSSVVVVLAQQRQAQVGYSPPLKSLTSISTTIWTPPKAGDLKCNIDATLNASAMKLGFDKVIRVHEDSMIMAKN